MRKRRATIETTDPVEPEGMSGRVLDLIGAYGMDAALDPRRRGTAPGETPNAGHPQAAVDPAAEAAEKPAARRSA